MTISFTAAGRERYNDRSLQLSEMDVLILDCLDADVDDVEALMEVIVDTDPDTNPEHIIHNIEWMRKAGTLTVAD